MGLGFLCPTSIFLSLVKNKRQINAPAVNSLEYDIKKRENFVRRNRKGSGGGGGGGAGGSYIMLLNILF